MSEEFVQMVQLVEGVPIVDFQTAANDGDWVSLKEYHNCCVIVITSAGTAADDPTLTMEQATDVSGADAKALNFTVIHTKQAATDLSGTGVNTRVTQAAAATYTEATSAEQVFIWQVDFADTELDAANDFDCLRARVADIGSNAQLGWIGYALYNPRNSQAILLSAIVD